MVSLLFFYVLATWKVISGRGKEGKSSVETMVISNVEETEGSMVRVHRIVRELGVEWAYRSGTREYFRSSGASRWCLAGLTSGLTLSGGYLETEHLERDRDAERD